MTEQDIQALVDIILQRILNPTANTLEKTKEILLISPTESWEKKGEEVLNSGKFNEYVCSKTSLNKDDSIVTKNNCTMQTVMSGFDALFLSGLTLKQLERIKDFKLEYPLVEIAAEALKLGKPVYILTDWVDVAGTPAFVSRVRAMINAISALGINFVGKENVQKTVQQTKKENDAVLNCANVHRIQGRLVQKQCFKNIMSGDVVIEPDAVITSTAKALIEKRGINIIRLQR